ncbi:hypothetical protein NP233_g12600 [Leucocoprinus birnbaumii]|uniref:Uncharacterized protein n=1 Tax=Leucocoprinus birnbaumii TaxID=56174 RepID=A0AAD5VFE0_9AGAR|nr:hypothetical protein NP233_g12600 [Leucocoprinus birnbaumii]
MKVQHIDFDTRCLFPGCKQNCPGKNGLKQHLWCPHHIKSPDEYIAAASRTSQSTSLGPNDADFPPFQDDSEPKSPAAHEERALHIDTDFPADPYLSDFSANGPQPMIEMLATQTAAIYPLTNSPPQSPPDSSPTGSSRSKLENDDNAAASSSDGDLSWTNVPLFDPDCSPLAFNSHSQNGYSQEDDPENTLSYTSISSSSSSTLSETLNNPRLLLVTSQGSRRRVFHPLLTGDICDNLNLDQDTECDYSDWYPFNDGMEFEMADFLFHWNEMSAGDIDLLCEIWNASLSLHGAFAPFTNHKDLYVRIDAIPYGDVLWKSFTISYVGEHPSRGPAPTWMDDQQTIWYHNPMQVLCSMIANPDFATEFDYVPYHTYINDDIIGKDPSTHGSFFVPIILGSDKTTVSIATGNNEYWPVYISIGNIRNSTQCLAPADDLDENPAYIIPRTSCHTAQLVYNFELLHVWDTYGIVGNIRPFTDDFPRANIHELLSPNILHQVIKGAFKDHLVTWVERYLFAMHTRADAQQIMDAVDRRQKTMEEIESLQHSIKCSKQLLAWINSVQHEWSSTSPQAAHLSQNMNNNLEDEWVNNGEKSDPFIELSKRASEWRLDPIDVINKLSLPEFPDLLLEYLQGSSPDMAGLEELPAYLNINLHHSAIATFYAPSDHAGTAGMRSKHIRAVKTWMNGSG